MARYQFNAPRAVAGSANSSTPAWVADSDAPEAVRNRRARAPPRAWNSRSGSRWHLEDPHVPRPQRLRSGERGDQRPRMRCGGHRDRPDPLGISRGQIPGDDPAPVVPDQVEGLGPHGVGQRQDVVGQPVQPIGLHLGRLGQRRVAPLVERQHPIAGVGQPGGHRRPRRGSLREPVQRDDHRPVERTRVHHLEPQAIVGELRHSISHTTIISRPGSSHRSARRSRSSASLEWGQCAT